MSETESHFPPGWDEERVRELIEHYDAMTEEELEAELDLTRVDDGHTLMVIPHELVPAVRALLAGAVEPAPVGAERS